MIVVAADTSPLNYLVPIEAVEVLQQLYQRIFVTLLKADLVLMDERMGVGVARRNGLRATGTLGILDEAARQGLLDLAIAAGKLKATTFRYPHALVAELLAENALRKKD